MPPAPVLHGGRGLNARGCLFALGALALFLAAFVPLALRLNGGRDRTIDADRLRRTYVAIALYENEHDGLPPGSLAFVRRDVDPVDLQSVADPHTGASPPFPLDPLAPGSPTVATGRVSWSYRYGWKEAGDPRATSLDPRRGLLADPWPGAILRVNMDGSLVEKPSTKPTFESLFGR